MIDNYTVRRALLCYGHRSQTFKAYEEIGELLTALSRHLSDPLRSPCCENIQEELADCFIMLSQLSIIFGDASVKQKITEKLERLETNLKREFGENE